MIGRISQGMGPVAVDIKSINTKDTSEKTDLNNNAPVIQEDFAVNLEDTVKAKLLELVKTLQNREQLMQSLPEDVKKMVQELLQQMSSADDVSQGLESMLKGQKNIGEQLNNLGNILEYAAVLNTDEFSEIQEFLKTVAELLKGQPEPTTEQSANKLLQLAKELVGNTALTQGNLKQEIEQLLQQFMPENTQQLSENEQKAVSQLAKQLTASTTLPQGDLKQAVARLLQNILPENMQQLGANEKQLMSQLVKLLGKNIPTELQQLSGENSMSELTDMWAGLKAIDAQQLKDVPPKTLQQTADALRQLCQELKEYPDKATMTAHIEQFVKKMSPDSSKVLEMFIKPDLQPGALPEKLLQTLQTLDNAALLNDEMPDDIRQVIEKMAENFTGKSQSLPTDIAKVLGQVAKNIMDNATTVEQLKGMMKELQTQLFGENPKLLENKQSVLEQLTKLFEGNIPQALQEAAVKHKLPELPKLWVLLKVLGAEQWQNTEEQNLQKSASVIKELAQSMYKSTGLSGEKQAEHSTLSFSVPLYFADGAYYPAHIHIYHQQQENGNNLTERSFETWLRVCIDTENIGVVDTVFRLYEDNKLDVRVSFPSNSTANEFAQSVPKLRKSLDDTKLKVTDIMINKNQVS